MAGIDYSPLAKAIGRLGEGLEALGREPENTLYRDAVIQRFEFTYGLAASLLERYLSQATPVPLGEKMTFPTLIRTGSQMGLLRSGWDVWQKFREARNLTSHVYNEDVARRVVESIPAFAEEAAFLLRQLESAEGRDGN
jgi:nucleotidyltransferase substrate binding protein (TIGR01987 family)